MDNLYDAVSDFLELEIYDLETLETKHNEIQELVIRLINELPSGIEMIERINHKKDIKEFYSYVNIESVYMFEIEQLMYQLTNDTKAVPEEDISIKLNFELERFKKTLQEYNKLAFLKVKIQSKINELTKLIEISKGESPQELIDLKIELEITNSRISELSNFLIKMKELLINIEIELLHQQLQEQLNERVIEHNWKFSIEELQNFVVTAEQRINEIETLPEDKITKEIIQEHFSTGLKLKQVKAIILEKQEDEQLLEKNKRQEKDKK